MTKITVHARNIDSKFKMALYGMAEFALAELIPSKRLRDNLNISIHLRHHSHEGEAMLSEDANKYRPRDFKVILNHHKMEVDDYGRKREDTELAHYILRTLGHELVHIRDYVSGILRDTDKGLRWKGEYFEVNTMRDYFNLPYEIEAYGREKGLLVGFLAFWKGIEKEFGEYL